MIFSELLTVKRSNHFTMSSNKINSPQIFSKFYAKDTGNDEIIEYRIQNLPEELFEDALNLYYEEFFPEEFLCSSRKLHEKNFETHDMINAMRKSMQKGLSIACFRNDGKYQTEIVAAHNLHVHSKNDSTNMSEVSEKILF